MMAIHEPERNVIMSALYTVEEFSSPMRAAYMNWQMRSYFNSPGWRAMTGVPGDPARTSARNELIGRGFDEAEVDDFLAREAVAIERRRSEREAREAYERTRRYRIRTWLVDRRDRVRLAAEVLRGRHECGGDDW